MRELDIFEAARRAPSDDCLVFEGRLLTFAEVAGLASAAVDRLLQSGVRSGDRVVLTPRADLDSAAWLYALFALGCPAVLVHPRSSDREKTAIVDRSSPAHIIVEAAPHEPAPLRRFDPISAKRTLAVVYTSGTRGTPRGALLSRGAFVASAAAHAAHLGWRSDDRWLLAMPPAHVGGLSILTRSLVARRCVILAPGPFDAREMLRTIDRERVTLLSVVPTMLRRMLEADPTWRPGPGLRAVLVGGAPLPDRLRVLAHARGWPIIGTYGCTETCSQVATQSLAQSGVRGCGVPLEGVELRIEDGEIQVRGDVLMDGYLDASNADAWTHDGWFRTGDLGELAPDGQLLVHGRADDLIITGGENVGPQEVEAWLQTVPGIVSACVFGLPDGQWGERVAAALVVEPGYDPDTLRMRMRAELAPHKRPRQVAVLDALPLNRSGKVDRSRARTMCEGALRPI